MITEYTDIHQIYKKRADIKDSYDFSKSSFIILNKTGGTLKSCINSVKEAIINSRMESEIIVTDIDSSPETIEDLMESYPTVRIIRTAKKVGWIELANLSISEATYNTVYLLNSNTILSRDIILKVTPYFENQNLFAISPLVLAIPDRIKMEDIETEDFVRYIYGSKIKPELVSETIDLIKNDTVEKPCPTLSAFAGMMILNKQKFKELSGFKTIYAGKYHNKSNFIFWSDIDLCYRAWKRGWGTVFLPDSKIFFIDKNFEDSFFTPLPYFFFSLKSDASSQLNSYFFYIKTKIRWKRNSYIFFRKNITDPAFVSTHKKAVKKIIMKSIMSFNILELFCYLSALIRIKLHSEEEFYKVKIYNDEKIFKIVAQDYLP